MIHLENLSGGFKIGKVESCDALDCLFNDKKGHCTTEVIEVTSKKGCITYQQDKEWLDKQLHKYIWYPVDDMGMDLAPVRVEEDESIRK